MKDLLKIEKEVLEFYIDEQIDFGEEYNDIVFKISEVLKGKKRHLRKDLDKISILGFDALIIYVKLYNSTQLLLEHYEVLEEYELCALLRDILNSVKNYLYDF
jgi:hypothetical protein